MTTFDEMLGGLKTEAVDWLWYDGYHDRPLSGWMRVKGRRYYFNILNDPLNWHSIYAVYNVPKAIRIPHMRRHRLWRETMGWGHDWRPGEARGRDIARILPGWDEFSRRDQNPTLPFHDPRTGITCRGLSDLREVKWLAHPDYWAGDKLETEDL